MTTLFILARTVHIGACLLFFSIISFDRFVAVAARDGYWQSRIRLVNLILLPVILVSGIGWFALVAANMSGQSLQFEILRTVWKQTLFGTVWEIRLLIWIGAVIVAFCDSPGRQLAFRKVLMASQLILSACLLGSLAWAGHGQESSIWHLLADILHLLAAGFWPTGLLPFALVLRRLRRTAEPSARLSLVALVQRFSAMSLGTVGLLAATGLVNSWYLVGSISNLLGQPYGRWLMIKIIFFLIAVAIGAVNLLRLKPRLSNENSESHSADTAAAQMQFNVWLEVILGTAVVIIVAILGILPP
jgi:putative copper resistance protein D